jgi:PAS domain S-box-containing protein
MKGHTMSNSNKLHPDTKNDHGQAEKEMTIEFLQLVNGCIGKSDLIKKAATFFQEKSGCSAVGIRLKDGDDYPYYEARGFPKEFLLLENSLCQRDEDGRIVRGDDSNPVIECMCGNVICGRFDPSKPFFTKNGSFWSNCTTDLLAFTTDADRQARTRNRCNGEGYESVALLPLASGAERLGLLQLNDKRKDMFSPETIRFWERAATYLAVAVSKFKAEEALQKSEEKYRVLFREMLNGFALHDIILGPKGDPVNYRFVDVNPAFERMTGLKRQAIIGKTVLEIMPGTERQWIETYGRVALTGKPVFFENFSSELDKYFEVTSFRPAPNQFACIFSDITERKRTEQVLQNTQKLESLGILAGGIAHDFNNLLGGIFGNIDMAAEGTLEKRTANYLSKALGTIDRARGLTQQLLTFAKGGAPIKKIESMVPFIQETVKFALSGSKVSSTFAIPNNLWQCEFDKNQVGQVIDNIVINAQQAMPDGGTIAITAANTRLDEKKHPLLPAGNYVRISISDQGIGMPKEILPRIFDPFFTTKSKGHGLGLATCYSIIRRHEGCIDVESEPGKGSTFSFFLPASSSAGPQKNAVAKASHKGIGTFLIMDDEEVIRETVGDMLKDLGYSIVSTQNGLEAIEYFRAEHESKNKIVAMIFDLTVPGGLGGREAVKEIRKIDKMIPVFVSSGYADDPVMAHPQKYGFTASISKPFRKIDLADILSRHLGVKK